MRFAAVACALALLASPYFFAFYEAERVGLASSRLPVA